MATVPREMSVPSPYMRQFLFARQIQFENPLASLSKKRITKQHIFPKMSSFITNPDVTASRKHRGDKNSLNCFFYFQEMAFVLKSQHHMFSGVICVQYDIYCDTVTFVL